MRRLRAALMRLKGLFGADTHDRELAEEIESHIQMQTDDNIKAGMDPERARREAMKTTGGVEAAKQAYREQRTVPLIENATQDFHFALRQLRKNPGFTCIAILMLALGMGASVAIFAFVDAALIKPLPYKDPTRLVDATELVSFGRANLSYPDYLDWKKMNKSFSSLEAISGGGYLLAMPSGAIPVPAIRVTDGFFKTLGIAPMLGRDFYQGEDLPSAPRTVILSYSAWQKRFGSKKDIVGQKISLSGVPYEVVGVMPRTFQFAYQGDTELWLPLHDDDSCGKRRSCHNLKGIARLKDGVTVAAANAEMVGIAKQLETQYPGDNRGQSASVIPMSEAIVGDIRPTLLMLLGGAGLLLFIACVNVASLLLVRSENRKREIAVRGALGASPARLVRQFVTEGLVLVAAGSVLGIALAYGGMQLLLHMMSKDMLSNMPYLDGLGLNLHVLMFASAVALGAAVLFALTPIVRLRPGAIRNDLAEGSRGSAGTTWRKLGANLVVIELATAVVLLVGAGLLGKSLFRLLHVDVGFQPDHIATVRVGLPDIGYEKDPQLIAVARQAVEKTSALPGVKSVALISTLPVSFNGNTDWIRFVGKPYHGEHNEVNQRDVSPNYFTTIQAKLARGRYFTEDEDVTKPLVVIINQALARKYFPNEDPIGQRIGNDDLEPKSIKEIVGIVEDVRDGGLSDEVWPAVYYPIYQDTDSNFSVLARTSQDEATILPLMTTTVHQIDPTIGTMDEQTMAMHIDNSPAAYLHRSTAWLVGGFAMLALILGVVGLYGVIAYSVSQRTREIGVRMALGAQRGTVYQLILKEAGRLTALGIAAGLICSVGAAMLASKMLFGIHAWDVPTLALAAVVLTVCALAASYIPARRAASVNPVEALRAE